MKPGLRLGAAAFAAGALLGPLREGVLAPWLGGLAAARAPRGLAEQAPGFVLLAWLAALPLLRRAG